MSTSLLYHAFGVRGYEYHSTQYRVGAVSQPRERLCCSVCCSVCGSARVFSKGRVSREFRAVPIGGKPVRVRLDVPRVRCRDCHLERQVAIPFAGPKKTYTHSFARYVLDLSQYMTIQGVAQHLGVSWDLVREIQQAHLQQRYSKPKLKPLERIAIDEIYVGKRYKFLTIVMDLDCGAIVFVGDGKGEQALHPFWKRLRSSGAKIRAVAADLSPAYSLAIRQNLPKATLVFDRFHLVKLLNEHLTELRRELQREAEDQLHKSVLKGTRWLLLKHPDRLDDTRNERQRLQDALALNHSLATAYYLKEDLRQVWNQPVQVMGEWELDRWIRQAEVSGIRQLIKFAKTLRTHRAGILAWYDHPISTGPLEGTNNKIKLLQRQAYGYRDLDFFKLKLLALHRSRHALVG
ncbi:MAG: ISL3 family transposase [Planctomycetota bacterium]